MEEDTEPVFSGGELLAGKYRIDRVIGQGGMGVVLAARHEGLNTNVAIKLLRETALQHTDVVGRFMREARAAVSLRSEHVARVFDVGELPDGRPYIVMERLEGRDLGDVIEQGPMLHVGQAVDYVLQACEAIAEAHRAGIIHRDLKPKNLFLTQAVHGHPLVKVLDFGISKVEHGGPGEMQLTKTAEVIGSPSYMSPEQLRASRDVDTRTDIWALGVILYELLTRRVPFYAETVTALVLVVVTERQPPIRNFRQDVPDGLEAIIARCLEKMPEHRFQSVVELVQALEPYSIGTHTTAAERIRAVAGEQQTRPMTAPMAAPLAAGSSGSVNAMSAPPGSPSQPVGMVPPVQPSSRINVHGGTSVAWGETQTHPGRVPVPMNGGRGGVVAVLSGLLLAGGMGGGALWYVKHASAQPPPTTASEGLPLPSGRKDLPPLPTPPPGQPEPPTPTTLPTVRKLEAPTPATSATAAASPASPARTTRPAPRPADKQAADKPADLDNIGRR
jgi:serine/threonine-protein kinase